MGTGGGGWRGEGFCDVGMVRIFPFFSFELGGEGFLPTKSFGGNGLLEPTVCD